VSFSWQERIEVRLARLIPAAAIGAVVLTSLCGLAYLTGVYTGYSDTWPAPQLKMLVRLHLDRGLAQTDRFGRLLNYPGKLETPCPPQDAKSAVLLVAGQSNAANYQGQRYQSADDRVVNFSEGRCYIAGSPLLGADGRFGESWTLLGNKLIRSGLYTKVILIAAAVGSSPVRRWAEGGDLNHMLIEVLRAARTRYTITGVLWHQGAADFALGTPEQTYRSDLKSLIDSIHTEGVTAPFYVSRSSLQLSPRWSEDNPISRAQAELVDGKSILAGPNTDHDVTAIDRFDGLHFSASGQEKFTDAWLRLLRP
jgi:Carbohydrate esterase, sialic acid-specific acetylesterase